MERADAADHSALAALRRSDVGNLEDCFAPAAPLACRQAGNRPPAWRVPMRLRRGLTAVTAGAVLLLAACAPGTATASPSILPTALVSATAPATRAPSPTPAGLSGCPAPQAESALPVLARVGGAPDDLAPTGDGGLWVSDESNGRITRLDARGAPTLRIIDPRGPE